MPTLLLVEDHEPNRDMLQRRLTRRGYDVIVAEDGERALLRAHEMRPHLVLMDLGLPDIDGWEVTRRLKGSPETRAIPIIALTAHAMPKDRDDAFAAGCDAFVAKPIDFDELLATIEALLARA
ncbi:MAG: two-component system response regulator [Deltaproteobacteria bacterium HGW-Deltaproteobacteria-14]|jgi:CheY-like chemotaxis protein|nr:MAG: two-component system response regulator [Deltaproteobacteria bacterium HGW-Deltaproteobacteria-14]